MNAENYVVLQGWMITELGLAGKELMAYALIYGFSQGDSNGYTGGLQYIADWLGTTKRTVMTVLSSLVEKGVIRKYEEPMNGVKFCRYVANFTSGENFSPVEKNVQGDGENFSSGVVKIFHGGSEIFSPNNKNNNINNKDNKKIYNVPGDRKTFHEPTVDEVKAYCLERKNSIDAEYFVDYYATRDWKLSNGKKMVDWKACVRTWEKNNYSRGSRKTERPAIYNPEDVDISSAFHRL